MVTLTQPCLGSTVLLSVISMLNEPNISSPANVDASVMYRLVPEVIDEVSHVSCHRNDRAAFDEKVSKNVKESKLVAKREGVIVPTSVDE